MARKFAYLAVTIWEDPDFIALDESTQRMYLFLLSQRDLSQAGLLPLRVRRWARSIPDGTDAVVRERLDRLVSARFVVVDHETEELLIRTFVRNDGVYRQPKVMVRMREDALQISSALLRAALLAELDRIPLDELSADPGGRNRDTRPVREVVAEVIEGLRMDLAEPLAGVSDTPGEGSPVPTCVRAGALPHPPTPIPQPPTSEEPSSSEVAGATSRRGDGDDLRPEMVELLDLLDECIQGNGFKVPNRTKKNRDAVRLLLDRDGKTVDQVRAAIRWATGDEFWRGNIRSMSKLREKWDQLSAAAARAKNHAGAQRPVQSPAIDQWRTR